MKKKVLLLLVICLAMSVLPSLAFTASAETSGTTGDCTWKLDNGILTISGSGAMESYSFFDESPWKYSNIKEIIFEEGVTSIGEYSFYGCWQLEKVSIPDTMVTIGKHAFDSCCDKLTSISIPEGVTTLDDWAFMYCGALQYIEIPSSVTYIGPWKTVTEELPPCDAMIHCYPDTYAEQYALDNDIRYKYISEEEDIWSIDGTVLTISGRGSMKDYGYFGGNAPWYEKRDIITDVIIEDGVTAIGIGAFQGFSNLVNVTIPDSVKEIRTESFEGCTSLEMLMIPESVISIGYGPFGGCDKLTIYCIGASKAHIYAKYEQYDNIPYKVVADKTWSIENTVLTVCCEGDMKNYFVKSLYVYDWITPWVDEEDIITKIVISECVDSISNRAFTDLPKLTDVVISEGVKEIKSRAFAYCENLTNVTIPESVNLISDDSFSGCSNLTIYCFPNTYAEQYAIDNDIPYVLLEKPHTHIWDDVEITVMPTEEHDGVRTYTCSECGETKTEAIEYIRGDMTGDGVLNSADAIYLLRSIMRPSKYPILQSANVDGDEKLSSADAVYLLRHIMRPSKYPLN